MIHTTTSELQHTFEFSSWREFVDYAAITPSEMSILKRKSRKLSRFESGSDGIPVKYWSGTERWNEAHYLATSGWPEGAQVMEKMFTTLRLPSNKARTVTRFSPHGPGSLSMGRYIDGHPSRSPYKKKRTNCPNHAHALAESFTWGSTSANRVVLRQERDSYMVA